jgi:hypothetical protein
VAAIVRDGRARWKVDNENHNVLKTKGYPLEHNFGHGKQHLASLRLSLNLLAFATAVCGWIPSGLKSMSLPIPDCASRAASTASAFSFLSLPAPQLPHIENGWSSQRMAT